MADKSQVKPTTAFTKRFSEHLRAFMADQKISQAAVAERIGKHQSFVSERTSGLRPCDTDIIAAVAALAEKAPRDVVVNVLSRMSNAAEAAAADELAARRQRRTPAAVRKASRKDLE